MLRGFRSTNLDRWICLAALGFACLALAPFVQAAVDSSAGLCGPMNGGKSCPKESQCCSRYGYCGTGSSYCASGCNPAFSFTSDQSCFPVPVCKPQTYTFGTRGNAKIIKLADYKKLDPDNVDFIIDTGDLQTSDEGIILTLKKDKVGTKITHTRAMRFGKMSVEMQSAWSGGVVTASVLMGDTDEGEVDIEFVGSALKQVQSNIFYNRKANGQKHNLDFPVPGTDTSTSFQQYSVDWTTDKVVWGYDGRTMRTVTSSSTSHIPQLPMYAQFSIWPGGESAAPGTVDWAGGPINWQDPRFLKQNSTFQFLIKSVTLECYDNLPSDKAYRYKRAANSKTIDVEVVDGKGYGYSGVDAGTTPTPSSSKNGGQTPTSTSESEPVKSSGITTTTGAPSTSVKVEPSGGAKLPIPTGQASVQDIVAIILRVLAEVKAQLFGFANTLNSPTGGPWDSKKHPKQSKGLPTSSRLTQSKEASGEASQPGENGVQRAKGIDASSNENIVSSTTAGPQPIQPSAGAKGSAWSTKWSSTYHTAYSSTSPSSKATV